MAQRWVRVLPVCAVVFCRPQGSVFGAGIGVDLSSRAAAPGDEFVHHDGDANGGHALRSQPLFALLNRVHEFGIGGVEGVAVLHGRLCFEPLGFFEERYA